MTDSRVTGEMNALTQYVLDQAKQRAEKAIAQATDKADQILKQAEERAKEHEQELIRAGMAEVERVRRQVISQAQLRFKSELLEVRANIIDQILAEVRNRLERVCAEDGNRYLAFLMELLEGSLADEKGDHVVLYLSERDAKCYERKLPQALASTLNLKKVEIRTSSISGGVVLELPSRHLQIDTSFDEIVREAIPEIERIVEEEVFVPLQIEENQDARER
jgi:V/A-type H+/Na+-transporting ATPase subunit E